MTVIAELPVQSAVTDNKKGGDGDDTGNNNRGDCTDYRRCSWIPDKTNNGKN
jgi:hypothetical protein